MLNILVLDDDADLLDMVSLVLTRNGMKVKCIKESTELQAALKEFKPQLVVMDIFLGTADGRELCAGLKADNHYKHLPIILYSAGFISHSSVVESKADDFLSKPFDIYQLVSKIRTLTGS